MWQESACSGGVDGRMPGSRRENFCKMIGGNRTQLIDFLLLVAAAAACAGALPSSPVVSRTKSKGPLTPIKRSPAAAFVDAVKRDAAPREGISRAGTPSIGKGKVMELRGGEEGAAFVLHYCLPEDWTRAYAHYSLDDGKTWTSKANLGDTKGDPEMIDASLAGARWRMIKIAAPDTNCR